MRFLVSVVCTQGERDVGRTQQQGTQKNKTIEVKKKITKKILKLDQLQEKNRLTISKHDT